MPKKNEEKQPVSAPSIGAAPGRYYVQHPIQGGPDLMAHVKVQGSKAKKAELSVGRKHVVDVSAGAEDALEKWVNNKCLVLFDPKEHLDAILPGYEPPAPKPSTSQSAPIGEPDEEIDGEGDGEIGAQSNQIKVK